MTYKRQPLVKGSQPDQIKKLQTNVECRLMNVELRNCSYFIR
jgi:hypothetical protein